MPIAYGYARVSTPGQNESGIGKEAQEGRIVAYYEAHLKPKGYSWGGIYYDGATSGGKPFAERAEAARLNRKMQRGDCIIVSKVDRAFRQLRDMLNTADAWKTRGVRAVFVDMGGQDVDTSTIAGLAVMFALGFAAQVEWMRGSERCKDKAAVARMNNRATNGRPPTGYRVHRRGSAAILIPDVSGRRLGVWMTRQYEQNNKLQAIADFLNARGIKNPRTGDVWDKFSVRKWILFEKKMRVLDAQHGSDGSTKFFMPNGKVVTLDSFPPSAQEIIRTEIKAGENDPERQQGA